MRRVRLLLLLVLLPLAFISLRETLAVDACLDQGGSYDYKAGQCDMTTSHPYEPFMDRHSVLIGATLVALMGAGVAIWLRRRALRERGS
ncbi:MAG TPA: hypothetical protein VF006_30800 [Longimicrobium sp.]